MEYHFREVTKDCNERAGILLSKRFRYPRNSILKLNTHQLRVKQNFERDLDNTRLIFHSMPCCCGKNDDIVLSTTDRYGFWVRTVICKYCGLLRTNPKLTPESLKIFYEVYYRSLYSGSKLPDQRFFEKLIARGIRIFSFVTKHTKLNSGTIFELGTGAGGVLLPFKNEGWDVIGVDFDDYYLQMGRNAGLNLLKGDIEVIIRLGVKADLIILSHVLEHVSDLNNIIEKLKECLNSKGIIYIEVPGLYSIPQNYHFDFLRYLQNAHLYHFTLDSLTQIFNQHGFELVFGDEFIKSVFKISETPKDMIYNPKLAKQVILFLQQLETRKSRLRGSLSRLKTRFLVFFVRVLEIFHLKKLIKRILRK